MAAQAPHLTVERAKELALIRGYVRVDQSDIKSSCPHKSSARVVSVINDETVEVLPWHGHGKTERVPLSALTEHKSKTQQHLELTMQRSPGALLQAAGMIAGSPLALSIPKLNQPQQAEPFFVIETEKKLVWGGPTGRHKGFQKSLNVATSFADRPAALRSIGKLKHTVGWHVNVEALKAVPKSEAIQILASRSLFAETAPQEEKVTPAPELETTAPEPSPEPTVEMKPAVIQPPPAAPKIVKSAPAPDLLTSLERVAGHIRDFRTAVEMAHEARNLALKEMEQITGNMDAVLAALEVKS